MNNNLDRTTDTGFYHDGSRRLQHQFATRRLADRLDEVQVHSVFAPEDRALIESATMFFLATADAHGQPDCSYKAGLPGFVREQFRGVLPRSEAIQPRSLGTYVRLLEHRSRLFRVFVCVVRRARESLDRNDNL